jgi:hypothetical protein
MSDAPLSEQELERLIARAIEIDAQEAAPTIARFRQIAAELNLSPVAIEKAIAERAAGALVPSWQTNQPLYAVSADATMPVRRESRWKNWLTAGTVAAGAALGAISGATSRLQLPYDDVVAATTVGLLVAISALLVWTHRRSRSSAQLMLQLASFWSTWMYGFMTSYGHFWDDILFFGACGFGLSAIAGTTLQSLLQRFRITRKTSSYVTPLPSSYATPNP